MLDEMGVGPGELSALNTIFEETWGAFAKDQVA